MAEPGLVETFKIVFAEKMKEELAHQAQDAGKATATAYEGGASSGLENFFKKIGGWLAAAFAVNKILDFGKESIKAAIESENAWNQLGFSLAKVGVKLSDARGELEKLGQKFLDKTTFGDEAALRGLNTLVQITGKYDLSLRAVTVAADLAAAKHLTLEEASTLVGRALDGNTIMLKRMGVELVAGQGVLAQLSAQFKGAAENELNTFGGKVQQLGQFWGELKEAIGKALIEAGNGTSVMDTLIGSLKGTATWVSSNKDQFVALAQSIKDLSGFLVDKFIPGLATIAPSWRLAWSPIEVEIHEVVAAIFQLRANLNTLPWGDNKHAKEMEAEAQRYRDLAAAARQAGKDALATLAILDSRTKGHGLGQTPSAGTGTTTFAGEGAGSGAPAPAVDVVVGSKAEREKALKEWKAFVDDTTKWLTSEMTKAFVQVKDASVEAGKVQDDAWKAANHKRLEGIRTETTAKIGNLNQQAQALRDHLNEESGYLDKAASRVLDAANNANAVNREKQEEEKREAIERHKRFVKHWADIGHTLDEIAGLSNQILSAADAWGIFGDSAHSQLKRTLDSITEVAKGAGDLAKGIATGDPGSIVTGGIEVIGGIAGLFNKNKDPGRLATNQEWYTAAAAGDQGALEKLFGASGHAGPGGANGVLPWATSAAQSDAWAKYQAAKAKIDASAPGAAPSGPTVDPRLGPQNTPEQEARSAQDLKDQQLRQQRANEEEGLRLRDLAEQQAAQDKLVATSKGLGHDLQVMVAAAVAAQRAAELQGETSPLGFDSPLYRDAASRADKQYSAAEKAVQDAIAAQQVEQKPAFAPEGALSAGFTVQRTVTETSANRLVAGIETGNIILTQIRDGVYSLRGTGVGNGAGPRTGGTDLAASFATHASLAGNAELPT